MANLARKHSYIKGKMPIPPDIPDIFKAAARNDIVALEEALDHYDVNVTDNLDMTPLHYAAAFDADDAVTILLDHPDVDATLCDKFGRDATTIALDVLGPEVGLRMSTRLLQFISQM